MIKLLTPETMEIYNAYTEWLNEDLNFEDHSVGMYWTPNLTESIIKDLEESFDKHTEIEYWDESSLILKDSGYRVLILKAKMQNEDHWIVAGIK